MKILIISNSGEGLPIAWRLQKEGVDVDIYVHDVNFRNDYDGIMQKIAAKNLKTSVKKADLVYFDMIRPNRKQKEDAVLIKMFGLKSSVPEIFGAIADKIKKDKKVVGASLISGEIELDRKKGMEIAKKMGFVLPEIVEFKTLKEGVKFLRANKNQLWVFKPDNNNDLDLTYVENFQGELIAKMENEYSARLKNDIEYILQEKIEGVEISTEVWIGQKEIIHYNHTIEAKRLMDGNLGPTVGSQSNTVWLMSRDEINNCPVVKPLINMANYLKGNGYRGPYDANCIIKDNVAYFLEHTPRAGYDALFCLLTLIVKGRLSEFFFNDNFETEFQDGFASSQRISIPPYPYSIPGLRKVFAKDVVIYGSLNEYPYLWAEDVLNDKGILKCGGSDGVIGVATAWGKTLDESCGRLYHNINKLRICSYLQYRTDCFKESQKRFSRLKVA